MNWWFFLLSATIAMGMTYVITPIVVFVARYKGWVDMPDARKIHSEPIPRVGGIALVVAFIIAFSICSRLVENTSVHFIWGAILIFIIGLWDDIYGTKPIFKLCGQILAVYLAILGGIKIEFISNPFGGILFLGNWSFLVTMIWMVLVINIINLIDGVDGLAGGITIIAGATLFLVGVITGQWGGALLISIVVGLMLGFLPYNFHPARIFMGDCGSMLIGYLIAVTSILGVLKSTTTMALAVPVLALGIPMFDTSFAVLRRLFHHQPIFQADRGHFHHLLLMEGLSQKQVVLLSYYISLILAVFAIGIVTITTNDALLILSAITFSILLFLWYAVRHKHRFMQLWEN